MRLCVIEPLSGGRTKKILRTVVDFLLSRARYDCCEAIGINTAPSYTASRATSDIHMFTCSWSHTAHLFSYNCISSQHSECIYWTGVRSSDCEVTAVHSQRGIHNRQKAPDAHMHRPEEEKSWEECVVKDWPSSRCVSRSFALKAEQRNREREREKKKACKREGRGSGGEDAKLRVKFPWMIPAFPTRLIKLWLC